MAANEHSFNFHRVNSHLKKSHPLKSPLGEFQPDELRPNECSSARYLYVQHQLVIAGFSKYSLDTGCSTLSVAQNFTVKFKIQLTFIADQRRIHSFYENNDFLRLCDLV